MSAPRGGALWTPASISGLKLWLDFGDPDYLFTDAGTTKVSADGDAIYQANDKSGNGYHAVQSTSSYRPAYKTAIKNGLSTAYFDGTDRNMLVSGFNSIMQAVPWTLFVVYMTSDKTRSQNIFGVKAAIYYGHGLSIYNSNLVLLSKAASGISMTAAAFDNSTWGLVTGRVSNGDSAMYKNSASATTSTASSSTQAGSCYVGSAGTTFDYLGYLAELIHYDSSLSDANRNAVETYLNNKWAIY